jgi:hypothetical protein
MISAMAPVVRLMKRLLLRCCEDGCWRHGVACSDIDLGNLAAAPKQWLECQHHLDLERVAELERQRNDPKIIGPGDRVRALKCLKPEECALHGSHEGMLASVTYSPEADSERPPWEPAKSGDLLFHINSDQGIHYQAIEIVKVTGMKPERGEANP